MQRVIKYLPRDLTYLLTYLLAYSPAAIKATGRSTSRASNLVIKQMARAPGHHGEASAGPHKVSKKQVSK